MSVKELKKLLHDAFPVNQPYNTESFEKKMKQAAKSGFINLENNDIEEGNAIKVSNNA